MHSIDKSPRHAAGRPGRKEPVRATSPEPIIRGRINRRTHQFGPLAAGAVSALVVPLLFFAGFAATRWLPDLTTSAHDNVAKSTVGTSMSTSADTTPSLQPPDVTPNPLIPIVIRRSTPANEQVSDLPPHTEISPSPITVPESVDAAPTPQQLDLRQMEDAKRVQQRLIDLGFLFGAADGVWGPRSRKALQDFRVANGIGDSDTWDEATQDRLLTSSDAIAANTADVSFTGGWGIDVAQCRESPLTITARRAEAFGAACEFHSTQRESSNVWRLRALCANNSERWNANIRFAISGSQLTWSSERGTTTYVRCPS
jgi:peptidoglycan hydrolase-like protein with peptidoglycan-binding domain